MKEKQIINIENKEGILVTTSREIAENFNKEHTSVLKTINGENRKGEHINGLIDGINESSGNPLRYFIPSEYTDSKGEMRKEYLLTRDGFSLLVMGFTGKKALEFKLKYIDAFNRMEETLKNQNQLSNVDPQMFLNLAQGTQLIANVVQGMQTTISQIQTYVADSINIKDNQIEETMDMVGIRDKNKKCLSRNLKEKLSNLEGKNIKATDKIYKKAKQQIFKEYDVVTWEQIPIGKYNNVCTFINEIEDINA